jgi:hypothetical protein
MATEHRFNAEHQDTGVWIATCSCGWRLDSVGYAWPQTARVGWDNEHVVEEDTDG